MLLLQDAPKVPLSVFLSGDDAIRSFRKSRLPADAVVRSEYVGEAEYLGLECHKVWVTTAYKPPVDHHRWELWLAEDRNYMPIRMFGWTFGFSEDLPASEGEVTELRDIASETWFPFRASITAYDMDALKRDRTQSLRWRSEYIVEEANLRPAHSRSFFENVAFANGTAVYEVVDDAVTRSYRIGGPDDSSSTRALSRWWLLAANIVLVGLIIFAARLRRHARNGARQAAG